MTWTSRNDNPSNSSNNKTRNRHCPIRPGPPKKLRKDGSKHRTNNGSSRRNTSEHGERHVLPHTWRIQYTQDRDPIGQHGRRPYALHSAAKVKEDLIYIDGDARKDRPEAEPKEASNEHAFVAEDVTPAACREDEGSHRKTVCCDLPASRGRVGDT